MSSFPALPGFYQLLFLTIEPLSTAGTALAIWFYPGVGWFHHELIPSSYPRPTSVDLRTQMAVWQLGSCYFLLGLISAIVFRSVKKTLRNDPVAQTQIVGSILTALAIADLIHVFISFIGLPEVSRNRPSEWNALTHGNISATLCLFVARMSWFLGIGR
ncbi:hypothetical protein C8J56DRAFT_725773, partial [Mycena floridula]